MCKVDSKKEFFKLIDFKGNAIIIDALELQFVCGLSVTFDECSIACLGRNWRLSIALIRRGGRRIFCN